MGRGKLSYELTTLKRMQEGIVKNMFDEKTQKTITNYFKPIQVQN